MRPSIRSPRCTAPTPAGVPVKIRSPGCSSHAALRCSMISSTLQIRSARSPFWRSSPLTCSVIAPWVRRPLRRDRMDRPDRRRLLEGLADAPGTALLLHVVLQVAAGHVQADAIAPDVLGRVGRRDVAPAAADGHDQFDLMVQVLGQARVGHLAGLAIGHRQRAIGRLEEEERRFAASVAHLHRVFDIVAPDAVDAVYRE